MMGEGCWAVDGIHPPVECPSLVGNGSDAMSAKMCPLKQSEVKTNSRQRYYMNLPKCDCILALKKRLKIGRWFPMQPAPVKGLTRQIVP